MAIKYSELIQKYKVEIQKATSKDIGILLQLCRNEYRLMYDYYEETEEKGKRRICEIIDKSILPKLFLILGELQGIPGQEENSNLLYTEYKLFLALSARKILRNFAFYVESFKNKKIWSKTMKTLEPAFFYADELLHGETLRLERVSCQAGLGKSYFGNLFVANLVGNYPNIQLLRVTYSDDLVKTTTKQTKAIIESQAFKDVFPRYKDVSKMFKADDNYSFCLIDCEDEYNLFSVTRDGQSSGKRAKFLIIDDLLKGQLESSNVKLHQDLVDRYDSDWSTRADDDDQKLLLLGTMWADTDLLNVVETRAISQGELVDDVRRKYTTKSGDGRSVFIAIPALDFDTDTSTCPMRFSTESLKDKRSKMSEELWAAVYQQRPIAPSGLEFAWDNLRQEKDRPIFDPKGNKIQYSRYASLDPARRGKNYVSMPIFYASHNEHYLVDWLYKKASMRELYDLIVDRIIEHRIQELIVEINTDTSLKTVLETKLRQRGYYSCTIVELYSTKNKEQRIKDSQGTVRNCLIFPIKGQYNETHEIGKAMQSVTSYSFLYPNKYDDAIDSLAIYADHFVEKETSYGRVSTFKRY